MSTDYQADQEPTITTGLSIAAAADRLGISENAVRQRIKRGTLEAVKVDGVWQVSLAVLADHEADHEPASGRDHETGYQVDHQATSSEMAVSAAARSQLAAIHSELVAPLVDRIEAQAEAIGRLTQERDQLRGDLEALRAPADAATEAKTPQVGRDPVAPPAQEGRRGLWRRLRSLIGGS